MESAGGEYCDRQSQFVMKYDFYFCQRESAAVKKLTSTGSSDL
jgi:hypothetical protein